MTYTERFSLIDLTTAHELIITRTESNEWIKGTPPPSTTTSSTSSSSTSLRRHLLSLDSNMKHDLVGGSDEKSKNSAPHSSASYHVIHVIELVQVRDSMEKNI